MKKPSTATERPKALDTLIAIVEQVIAFRYETTPRISDVARTVALSSRLLHIRDLDEKISVENMAVLTFCKARGLVG